MVLIPLHPQTVNSLSQDELPSFVEAKSLNFLRTFLHAPARILRGYILDGSLIKASHFRCFRYDLFFLGSRDSVQLRPLFFFLRRPFDLYRAHGQDAPPPLSPSCSCNAESPRDTNQGEGLGLFYHDFSFLPLPSCSPQIVYTRFFCLYNVFETGFPPQPDVPTRSSSINLTGSFP